MAFLAFEYGEPRAYGEFAELCRGDAGYVLTLFDDLDLANVPLLREAQIDLEQNSDAPLIIDLSGLKFIDSAGLKALMDLCWAWQSSGRQVALLRPSDGAGRIFRLTGTDSTLPFLD